LASRLLDACNLSSIRISLRARQLGDRRAHHRGRLFGGLKHKPGHHT